MACRVATARTNVVFPAPFGPRTATTWPGRASRSSPFKATVFPNRFTIPFASIVGVIALSLRSRTPFRSRTWFCTSPFDLSSAVRYPEHRSRTCYYLAVSDQGGPVVGRAGGDVPEPPWRAAPQGQPRTPLTRDSIIQAALRVLQRDGVEALSMRKVGEELGTGAASLYWHVRNKDELLQLVFEHVTAEVELPVPDPSRWQEQLRALARQMRQTMHRHRGVARISLGRIPAGPTLARTTEWLFELLRPVGVPDRVIGYVGDVA